MKVFISMGNSKTRVLVLGASGMLGSTIFRVFFREPIFKTLGTIRKLSDMRYFSPNFHSALIPNIYLEEELGLQKAFAIAEPDVVINCVGIIKQLPYANNYIESLKINAILPHRLAKYCDAIDARLVHFSTDCVFSGKQGLYMEEDFPDSHDLYGRTKFLGEVNYGNSITLRTSIIGHEVNRAISLIDWFLSQSGEVNGYSNAVFSGLPTIEVARVVKEYVISNPKLSGLYHLSVDPINKFDLLNLVANVYEKNTKIIPDDKLVIDRSLNSDRFRLATGFKPKSWPNLIKDMHEDYMSLKNEKGGDD